MGLRAVRILGCCFAASVLLAGLPGCASLGDYVAKGFKVGPDYCPPAAPVAPDWIDAGDERLLPEPPELASWWQVFGDPTLDTLVQDAARQNLTLRQAGYRVMQARAARAIAAGKLLPQHQDAFGDYGRNAVSRTTANTRWLEKHYFDQWDAGFNLAWEVDFWGRFRRAVEAADAELDASAAACGEVLVTLLGDVATTYVEIRTLQQRVELVRKNIVLQQETYTIAEARFRGGQVSELDVDQAASALAQTEAAIPELEFQIRHASNRLCVLLGMPPRELETMLGGGPIPAAPAEVAVGIPADLLRRRPDVRRAEREVAAESANVGVATAELYPHIALTGTIGLSSREFSDLFQGGSLAGGIGPSFQWNVLNYGRLLNNIRLHDARLAERVAAYQQTVLVAGAEVETGLARFLFAQRRAQHLGESVHAAERAAAAVVAQYRSGLTDFNRVALIEQNLVAQQDLLAQAEGEIALGLIDVYRALGGGWPNLFTPQTGPASIVPPEELPPGETDAPDRDG